MRQFLVYNQYPENLRISTVPLLKAVEKEKTFSSFRCFERDSYVGLSNLVKVSNQTVYRRELFKKRQNHLSETYKNWKIKRKKSRES